MLRIAPMAAALLLITATAQAQSEPVGDYVEINGMKTYYEVSGEGEPLVVLHGAYMNIPAMGAIIPEPFAMPEIETVVPSNSTVANAALG